MLHYFGQQAVLIFMIIVFLPMIAQLVLSTIFLFIVIPCRSLFERPSRIITNRVSNDYQRWSQDDSPLLPAEADSENEHKDKI